MFHISDPECCTKVQMAENRNSEKLPVTEAWALSEYRLNLLYAFCRALKTPNEMYVRGNLVRKKESLYNALLGRRKCVGEGKI